MNLLQDRDWHTVERSFQSSAPRSYAVLDDFLHNDHVTELRTYLLRHWAWRYKNWVSDHLHNERPDVPLALKVASETIKNLPVVLSGLSLVDYWSLMYIRNKPGKMHSDNASVTLTLWLTDDKYNFLPDHGGLLLSDVLRPDSLPPHHHLVSEFSEPYVSARSKGDNIIIPYRCNRAVLFDARIFHKTDRLGFRGASPMASRINLSLAFDAAGQYERRMQAYRNLLANEQR